MINMKWLLDNNEFATQNRKDGVWSSSYSEPRRELVIKDKTYFFYNIIYIYIYQYTLLTKQINKCKIIYLIIELINLYVMNDVLTMALSYTTYVRLTQTIRKKV